MILQMILVLQRGQGHLIIFQGQKRKRKSKFQENLMQVSMNKNLSSTHNSRQTTMLQITTTETMIQPTRMKVTTARNLSFRIKQTKEMRPKRLVCQNQKSFLIIQEPYYLCQKSQMGTVLMLMEKTKEAMTSIMMTW